jgi:hypothetical protein
MTKREIGQNRDPIYAPDGRTWYDTLLDEAEKRGQIEDRNDDLLNALQRIVQWSEAYPLDIFPTPDLKKARDLLAAGGITLDAISAHCMRLVVEGVGKIARAALGEQEREDGK